MKRKDLQALAAIALFYIVIESAGITCPIRFLSGISCAGCGMSRAWLSLLRLVFSRAFWYHPLFWLPVPAAAVLLFQRRLPKRMFQVCMGICGVLFLAVYLVRLFMPGEIVVCSPAQGLVGRLISELLGRID